MSDPHCRNDELKRIFTAARSKSRLGALRELCAGLGPRTHARHQLPHPHQRIFQRLPLPTEAVWQAAREGLAVLGINDHYTVAGHEEFRRACAMAGIAATFSLEAVAMDRAAEAAGLLLNDPDNPGRVYLCGKGVTRIPADSSPEMQDLARMRAALERRNVEMTAKVGDALPRAPECRGPAWETVRGADAARQHHRAARGLGNAGALAGTGRRTQAMPLRRP